MWGEVDAGLELRRRLNDPSLRLQLSQQEFEVLRKKGTERAGSGEYNKVCLCSCPPQPPRHCADRFDSPAFPLRPPPPLPSLPPCHLTCAHHLFPLPALPQVGLLRMPRLRPAAVHGCGQV